MMEGIHQHPYHQQRTAVKNATSRKYKYLFAKDQNIGRKEGTMSYEFDHPLGGNRGIFNWLYAWIMNEKSMEKQD